LGEVKARLAGGALGNLASPGSAMLEMLAASLLLIIIWKNNYLSKLFSIKIILEDFMKNVLSLLFVFLFVGCYGTIQVKNDNFNNSIKTEMSMLMWADPILMGSNEITFTKEYKNKNVSPTVLHMKITTAPEFGNISQNVSIKVGTKIYPMKLGEMGGQIDTTISQDAMTGKLSADSDKTFNVVLTLNNEVEKAIMISENIMIRISLGSKDATFAFTGSDVNKLKEFISFDPNKRK